MKDIIYIFNYLSLEYGIMSEDNKWSSPEGIVNAEDLSKSSHYYYLFNKNAFNNIIGSCNERNTLLKNIIFIHLENERPNLYY